MSLDQLEAVLGQRSDLGGGLDALGRVVGELCSISIPRISSEYEVLMRNGRTLEDVAVSANGELEWLPFTLTLQSVETTVRVVERSAAIGNDIAQGVVSSSDVESLIVDLETILATTHGTT